jgi:hypothetical protein
MCPGCALETDRLATGAGAAVWLAGRQSAVVSSPCEGWGEAMHHPWFKLPNRRGHEFQRRGLRLRRLMEAQLRDRSVDHLYQVAMDAS